MSEPTTLSPWYVVFHHDDARHIQYYTTDDEQMPWTRDRSKAMVFMSFPSATRVANAMCAAIMVLWTDDHAKEFERCVS